MQKFFADIQKSQNPFSLAFPICWGNCVVRGIQDPGTTGHGACRGGIQTARRIRIEKRDGSFGNGPFAFQRFVFKGVDRGFELKSAYAGADAPFAMIFVEKEGPPFHIDGPHIGQAVKP